MKQAKIGVQMFNLKSKIAEIGIYETFRKIKELGFSHVEVTQIAMSADNVAELKKASQAFGVEIAAISAPLDTMPGMPGESLVKDFDKIVNDCKTLNCQIVRIGMMPIQIMGNPSKIMSYIEEAEAMAERLAEQHIALYYHNHHLEFEKYDGKFLLDIMRERTTRLGFEIDVHWAQRGGENPVTLIERFAGRISLLHLKDYRIGRLDVQEEDFKDMRKFMYKFSSVIEFAELGAGSLDITGIMDAGLASGVKYFLIEQDDTYGRDPFECLEASANHLRQLGYGNLF